MRVAGLGLRAQADWPALAQLFAKNAVSPPFDLALPAHLAGHPLSARLESAGYRVSLIALNRLRGVETLTRSPRILSSFGTGSLAEACALIAAGPDAYLTGARQTAPDGCITLAFARIGDPL